jgi:hypothetical protein
MAPVLVRSVQAWVAFLLVGLYTATGSPLGLWLSSGESQAFAWLRAHATPGLWAGLGLLALVTLAGARRAAGSASGKILAGAELLALGAIAAVPLGASGGLLPWAHLVLQGAILAHVLRPSAWAGAGGDATAGLLDRRERHVPLFLTLLFVLAAAPAALDPGAERIGWYVALDSTLERSLTTALPALLSGVTGAWLGLAALAVFTGARTLRRRVPRAVPGGLGAPVVLAVLAGLYGVSFVETLASALALGVRGLDLGGARLPLALVLATTGVVAGALMLRRLVGCTPAGARAGPLVVVALSAASCLILPLAWALTRPGTGRVGWRALLWAALAAPVALALVILYGGLFDPWFTVFSYLKGGLMKALAVVAAAVLVLLIEEYRPAPGARAGPTPGGAWAPIAAASLAAGLMTAAAIVGFDRHPAVKSAVLEFNEFAMVDATYAREASHRLGLGRWVRLGQPRRATDGESPWPQPWTLEKTHASRLPPDFNLLVIVVDALRGDAFHSAGYPRNLTPFLDRWALEEAVSFRRAYSPGGGTFAAFPFLVGGRSRFTLYGPGLHRENLYLALARAEGIRQWMVVKGYGPREIFPPEAPVIELGPGGDEGPSASADETFGWFQSAVDALPPDERFLAFLHLMDVHTEMWKKEDGLDFGDGLRDLYDNNLSYLDRAFARFVAWLRARGLYERTVILFTSDHGEQFWEHGATLHGHTLYEEDLSIPLILLAHGVRGRFEDVPATSADMVPTIVDLAGYSVDPPYDDPRMGISLVPLLLGQERDRYLERDVVGRASFTRRFFLYRDWRWKLIYSADFDLVQLYDVATDPHERRNLVQRRPALAAELERELVDYLAAVGGRTYRSLLSRASAAP